MSTLFATLKALGEVVFLVTGAPLVIALAIAVLACNDLLARFRRKSSLPSDEAVPAKTVSVVIPSWNGREHLERNLASVLGALADNPDHEVIVVDNASTDGTAEFLREKFPTVRILSLDENRGFGGGANAGFEHARNPIVLLLNNDMRVEKGFLAPLVEGFSDPRVFAVTAQIFFSDPARRREETGLTRGLWSNGRLSAGHIIDEQVRELFPAFYAGGGSSAYDRRKFLELGGFDPLWKPFYLEDTDISHMAWKRGWFVLYQPRSVVHHDHRGTIGKHFSEGFIQKVLEKNHLLFAWKNIHEWRRLLAHFGWLYAGLWMRLLAGPATARPNTAALLRALGQFAPALRSRNRARRMATIGDTEAFRRPLGGYFRDRFGTVDPEREKLNVLFVSPYPIEPPLHGGALFMNQTVRHLAPIARLHLLCLLDQEEDLASNRRLAGVCTSAEFVVRRRAAKQGVGGLKPRAVQEFDSTDFLWRIHRSLFVNEIDAVQFDYTQLANYSAEFQQIATFLFEHDIYFQSILRGIKSLSNPLARLVHFHEYLRALRFELTSLARFDAIQVCTSENRRYLESFGAESSRIRDDLRASIDATLYRYSENGREPDTMLFVGSFQHPPNQAALAFFVEKVLPRVLQRRPSARLVIAGAQAPPGMSRLLHRQGAEFLGRVPEIRDVYARYAVFVCPILSGSGVRVKLLEAFAAGMPAVSTTIGAEGLAESSGGIIELADTAEEFAQRVLAILENPAQARGMARRARQEVERHWDAGPMTRKLEQHYREVLRGKIARHRRRASLATFRSVEQREAAWQLEASD